MLFVVGLVGGRGAAVAAGDEDTERSTIDSELSRIEAHSKNLYDKGEQSLTFVRPPCPPPLSCSVLLCGPQQCRYASPSTVRSNGTKHVRELFFL